MNILLVDDRAKKGWKEIIQEVLTLDDSEIQVEETIQKAIDRLNNETFDLLFLDLRFGEEDHKNHELEEFGGYKILRSIKSDFDSQNFATPVILFTATNKIWNIDFMLNEGVDNYYIKEHPTYSYDLSFSRQNYERLKNCFPDLIGIGNRRRQVWEKIQKILNDGKFNNDQIRKRVEEKLKIGYGILFRDISKLEKRELLFNQEVVAFIVFWSILEEVCKDSFEDKWDKSEGGTGMKYNEGWVLQNGKPFIEYFTSQNDRGRFKVHISWSHEKQAYEATEKTFMPDDESADNYGISHFKPPISLREQVWAILLIYKEWNPQEVKNEFKYLREYRNKIDFIHSSNYAIFNESLESHQDDPDAFKKTFQMLNFLEKILV